MKRLPPVLLILLLLLTLVPLPIPVSAAAASTEIGAGDIVILYTNDVHSYIARDADNPTALTYDKLAALRADMLRCTNDVYLVDAGDHIQGTAYGAMDEGRTVLELMAAAGYSLATPGNHEFDYGMERALDVMQHSAFPYISCNFVDLRTGKTVLDPAKSFTGQGGRVAFIGITTPATVSSTAPAYFADENGRRIYDILGGEDGKALYAAVQSAIDAARAAGADYVIALGHLGNENGDGDPWSSRAVIANTSGLDAFIDGHSHTKVLFSPVKNRKGEPVLLTQTGEYFNHIGRMVIRADGSITTELLPTYADTDAAVRALRDTRVAEIDTKLGEQFAESDISFAISENGQRAVRVRETNLGDFVADAYYHYLREVDGLDCDVALVNGGGIRADVPAGSWSYMTAKTVNPFGNVLCMIEVTGQQLLDALEWGARHTTGIDGQNENGAFLQVAGIQYRIDPTIPSTVQALSDGIWQGGPTGEYRVRDVYIYDRADNCYHPLDRNADYTVAGTNFTLRNGGDGYAMFAGATLIKDYIVEDYMAIAAYARAFADTDGDGIANLTTTNSPLRRYGGYRINYTSLSGSGRIILSDLPSAAPDTADPTLYLIPLALAAACIAHRLRRRNDHQIF